MTSTQLIRIADRFNLQVYNFKLTNKKAFSVEHSTIVLDETKIESDREFREVFSEEMGHCITQSFYPLSSCNSALQRLNTDKMERRAKNCSYRLQVPLYELKRALAKYSDDYEVAEALDVEIDVLREAVAYYHTKDLL
jgi:Zn-dependent peptidase ImmA (M78 family)